MARNHLLFQIFQTIQVHTQVILEARYVCQMEFMLQFSVLLQVRHHLDKTERRYYPTEVKA